MRTKSVLDRTVPRPPKCPRGFRHWFTEYGQPGVRRATCAHCGALNPYTAKNYGEVRDRLEAVAWCSDCEWWLPPEEVGTGCPGEECRHRLQRRVGYICHECEEAPVFFDLIDFEKHQAHVHESTLLPKR